MKLINTLLATTLFAAAALSHATLYNVNANFEMTVLAPVGEVSDQFEFTLGNADAFGTAFKFSAGALDATVSLFKKENNGGKTAVAGFTPFKLTTTEQSFTIKNLGAGTYFYSVDGISNKFDSTGTPVAGAYNINQTVAPVPEPETYALMGMGLVGLLAARRRKIKQA